MKFRDLMKNAFNKKGRSLQQAGAMFVEYAMALAFVIVVGVVFLSDGAMQNSIASILGKAERTVARAGVSDKEINAELGGLADNHGNRTFWDMVKNKSNEDRIIYSDKYDDGKALSSWTYDARPGKGYSSWTNIDIQNKPIGSTVNVIVYRNNSTNINRAGDEFYIGTATVDSNHHLSNVNVDFNSTKYTNTDDVLKAYNNLSS